MKHMILVLGLVIGANAFANLPSDAPKASCSHMAQATLNPTKADQTNKQLALLLPQSSGSSTNAPSTGKGPGVK